VSQRIDGFRGGIQSGTVATDIAAKALDEACKVSSTLLAEEMSSNGYVCIRKMNKKLLNPLNVYIGCAPDGGAWFRDGKLVAVFEAKKQGIGGNAIERWVKNYEVCKRFNPDVKYVTFGSGAGFEEGNYCWRFAKSYIDSNRKFNELYSTGTSWFINPEGFTQNQIISVMREALTI